MLAVGRGQAGIAEDLTWVQVQRGIGEGLWFRLNPRTGRDVVEGGGEPEVQDVLRTHLRAGMTFYDVGANIGFFSLAAARLVGPERARGGVRG